MMSHKHSRKIRYAIFEQIANHWGQKNNEYSRQATILFKFLRYLHDSAWLGEDVVDGVTRDPDHGGERHQQPEDLGPTWVHVVVAVGDGGVGDAVEDEHPEHHERGEVLPAEIPEHVGPDAGHLLHAVTEPLGAEHPADGDGLEEAGPEQSHARAAVEIHQLESIYTPLDN